MDLYLLGSLNYFLKTVNINLTFKIQINEIDDYTLINIKSEELKICFKYKYIFFQA